MRIQMFKYCIMRTYHTPCEIQSVVIDSTFKAWLMMTVVIVISVVVVVVVISVVAVVVVVIVVEVVLVVVGLFIVITATAVLVVTVVVMVEVVLIVVIVTAVLLVVVEVLLLVVVLLVVIVVRALVCAGAVIGTLFIEVLTVDMRGNAVIILFDMAVGLLVNALSALMCGVLTNIDVDVFLDVNVNAFAGKITTFEFAMPDLLEGFRC